MKRFFFFLLFLIFLFLPRHASADEGWVIDTFQSDIAIQQSGEVRVVETLQVDFRGLQKHGIYREIPYVYESDGKKTYTEITVTDVLQNNKKAKYKTSHSDGYVELKIGDSDKTISGKNSYTITYMVKGVLRGFSDHDELYWNVTGNEWPVPITKVAATVTLPKSGITKMTCYQGYAQATKLCRDTQASEQLAQFMTTKPLSESQGLTVVVGYNKDLIPLLTVERPKSFWEKFIEVPSLVTLALVIIGGLVGVLLFWYRQGRDFWFAQNIFGSKEEKGKVKPIGAHETITVEFTPPEKLRPGEIGVLMDERADTHDVVATIIDLAARGYLSITEIPKKWLFGKMDYQLKKKSKDEKGLLEYEKKLLHNLFKTGIEVNVSGLKQTFYQELKEVKTALYKEVVKKKLFPTDPEKVRNNYLVLAMVLLFGGIGLCIVSISTDIILLADVGGGIAISALLFLFFVSFMPRRTAYGSELYRRARGYYLFINTSEKHRQQFFEKKNMFNEVLPYAIVFGLTKKFTKQMQDMGIEPSTTGWYSGVHPITAGYFAASVTDFSNSMSSAIASTPSSSGGFSGGSSGGGFGGGGGGSW
ncbi:MAG: DUF2207 domain-containing protein [Acidobacteriota bacterium]